MQRNKQVAMGRKKFNMDPKKVSEKDAWEPVAVRPGFSAKLSRGLAVLVAAHTGTM